MQSLHLYDFNASAMWGTKLVSLTSQASGISIGQYFQPKRKYFLRLFATEEHKRSYYLQKVAARLVRSIVSRRVSHLNKAR